MSTTHSPKATPLMRKVAATLIREGSVQIVGLLGQHRDADGNIVARTQDRAVMRLFLEREAQRPVSLTHLGATAIYELV